MTTKAKSKPQRWADALSLIREGIDTLRELQQEYQEWLDNLPENLLSSATRERLQEVIDASIDSLESAVNELDIELPRGFGRD